MIVGIDETGRGCWAGPLVAAAVLLDLPILGLADSKKLTRLQREKLAAEIKLSAVAYGVGWVTPKEIDEIGLTAATRQAMQSALSEINLTIDKVIYPVLIDGNFNYLCSCNQTPCTEGFATMIKADALVPAVSAASILAKTERDAYMRRAGLKHPLYQFEKHVGYGTSLHHRLLRLHGVCELHRLSYKPVKVVLAGATDV